METWLRQAGIVKKLQIFLLFSVIFNCFFLYQNLTLRAKPHQEPISIKQHEKGDEPEKQISEISLKNFLKDYLNYFFSTDLVAQSFIEKNTANDLYQDLLKEQIEQRKALNLQSKFNILDIYYENLSESEIKIVLVGIESFVNQAYQEREITMILNIKVNSKESFTVVQIPKFEVKE